MRWLKHPLLWVILVIIAMLATAGVRNMHPFAQIPPSGAQTAEKADHGKREKARADSATKTKSFDEQPAATDYKADCSKREDADLCAQRRMAQSADAQTRLSEIGLGLLLFTFLATVCAVIYARRAALAARHTVVVMQDTAKRQLRAYLQITKTQVTEFEAGKIPKFHMVITNTGQTPARSVRVTTSIFNTSDPPNHKVKFSPVSDWSTATIGAGNDMHQSTPCSYFTGGHHAAAINKATTFGLATRVRYFDVFGRRHWLTFMALLDPSVLQGGAAPLLLTKRHNMGS